MSYSNKDMKKMCLDLAEEAEPLEAEALRSVAEGYETSMDEKPKELELGFRQIAIITAAIYVVWTPLYFWVEAGYVHPPVPTGTRVEQIMGFKPTNDGRFTARAFKFGWTGSYQADPVPLIVYEDMMPLQPSCCEFQKLDPANLQRVVTISTSDGSSPATNGHKYFVVLP
jgi:hypothetical protein